MLMFVDAAKRTQFQTLLLEALVVLRLVSVSLFAKAKLTCGPKVREWLSQNILSKLSLTCLARILNISVRFVQRVVSSLRVFSFSTQINLYKEGEKTPYHYIKGLLFASRELCQNVFFTRSLIGTFPD